MARASDLHGIYLENLNIAADLSSVQIGVVAPKQTRSDAAVVTTRVAAHSDPTTCSVEALRELLARPLTSTLRKAVVAQRELSPLFALIAPKKKESELTALTTDSIARVITDALTAAGACEFGHAWTAHSVRGATASKAHNLGRSFDEIALRAHWSNIITFRRSYLKRVLYTPSDQTAWRDVPMETLLRAPAKRV